MHEFDDIATMNKVIADLHKIRDNLQRRLDMVNGHIVAALEIAANMTDDQRALLDPSLPLSAGYGDVRNAILQYLSTIPDGADTKAIGKFLRNRFINKIHPKSHYGALKRLADEGHAQRTATVWTITEEGRHHIGPSQTLHR